MLSEKQYSLLLAKLSLYSGGRVVSLGVGRVVPLGGVVLFRGGIVYYSGGTCQVSLQPNSPDCHQSHLRSQKIQICSIFGMIYLQGKLVWMSYVPANLATIRHSAMLTQVIISILGHTSRHFPIDSGYHQRHFGEDLRWWQDLPTTRSLLSHHCVLHCAAWCLPVDKVYKVTTHSSRWDGWQRCPAIPHTSQDLLSTFPSGHHKHHHTFPHQHPLKREVYDTTFFGSKQQRGWWWLVLWISPPPHSISTEGKGGRVSLINSVIQIFAYCLFDQMTKSKSTVEVGNQDW